MDIHDLHVFGFCVTFWTCLPELTDMFYECLLSGSYLRRSITLRWHLSRSREAISQDSRPSLKFRMHTDTSKAHQLTRYISNCLTNKYENNKTKTTSPRHSGHSVGCSVWSLSTCSVWCPSGTVVPFILLFWKCRQLLQNTLTAAIPQTVCRVAPEILVSCFETRSVNR